jgi:hypothetical protein
MASLVSKTTLPRVSPPSVSRVLAGMVLIRMFVQCPPSGAQSKIPSPRAAAGPSGNLSITIPLTLQKDAALNIALAKRLAIGGKDEPVEGRLVQPVYAFDRIAAPPGTKVPGHVTSINTAPRMERVQAMVRGNFRIRR